VDSFEFVVSGTLSIVYAVGGPL